MKQPPCNVCASNLSQIKNYVHKISCFIKLFAITKVKSKSSAIDAHSLQKYSVKIVAWFFADSVKKICIMRLGIASTLGKHTFKDPNL
jgi:hypothetical protein